MGMLDFFPDFMLLSAELEFGEYFIPEWETKQIRDPEALKPTRIKASGMHHLSQSCYIELHYATQVFYLLFLQN